MKRTYDYLVAYNFDSDKYIGPCTGTIQLSLKKKIRTFSILNEVIDFIKQNNPEVDMKNVSIYNFILLGRNKH